MLLLHGRNTQGPTATTNQKQPNFDKTHADNQGFAFTARNKFADGGASDNIKTCCDPFLSLQIYPPMHFNKEQIHLVTHSLNVSQLFTLFLTGRRGVVFIKTSVKNEI